MTDEKGLAYLCPSQATFYADKGYYTKPARIAIAKNNCHLAAIKNNNL